MSERTKAFAEQWFRDNQIEDTPDGPVSASELAHRLTNAALKAGIPVAELEDDTDSVFELVFAELERRRTEAG